MEMGTTATGRRNRPGNQCLSLSTRTSKWEQDRTPSLLLHQPELARQATRISHQVIIDLIAATTTTTGLTVKSKIDTNIYEKGLKISDPQMTELQLRREKFHGDWNYKLLPRR